MSTYVATDFHGMYSLWKQIKEYMKPEDTLYYLGDAIDRGPHGWDIFTELIDDPRVIYIKGNHEDMMYHSYVSRGPVASQWFKHWQKNGGKETHANMQDVSFQTRMEYIDKIRDMSTFEVYENKNKEVFILTHAGCTPNEAYWKMDGYDWEYANIWSRKHFLDEWPQELNGKVYIIHGHTPVQLMYTINTAFPRNDDGLPILYCDGHKINLDTGAFDSNQAVLYNLDTNKIELLVKGE